ncbi:MAG: contractile injection system protein, VgrG/Pvc8 family [Moraxellaceae bacterium]|nr:contractile injection system protein, VgrG/Pvc8 family [Moraxellaceae bacterium]
MAETPLAEQIFYNPRPTLRIAGQPDVHMSNLLLALRMDESEGGMSRAELRFSNLASTTDGGAEAAFDENSDLKLGAEIAVYCGDASAPREVFRGKVTAMEHLFSTSSAPQITVLAEDALQAARMARRSKVYDQMSPADVVNAIASELGLRPTITGLTAGTGTWAQIGESDLSFLRRLLARFDADLQIVGEELQVSPRGDVQRGSVELTMFSQLARARVIADLADQVTGTTCGGWDAVNGSTVSGDASAPTHAGPGSGKTGARVLQETLGERSEHVGHLVASSDDEARAIAEAAFDQRARRFVRIAGVAEGNAQLRVGTHVNVSGLSRQFDNTYYVVRTCHLYDLAQGYRTEFDGECAYLGGA